MHYAIEAPDEMSLARLSPWLLRLELDRSMMVDKKLSMGTIQRRVEEEYSDLLNVVTSDDNAAQLVVRLRILSDADDKGGGGGGGGGDDEVSDETRKKLDGSYLRDLQLQGVPGIRKVFLRTSKRVTPDAGAATGFATEEEWLLDTEGCNLMSALSYPGVDATRTTSNDLIEILRDLGIEATRLALLKELRNVIEFDGE